MYQRALALKPSIFYYVLAAFLIFIFYFFVLQSHGKGNVFKNILVDLLILTGFVSRCKLF